MQKEIKALCIISRLEAETGGSRNKETQRAKLTATHCYEAAL